MVVDVVEVVVRSVTGVVTGATVVVVVVVAFDATTVSDVVADCGFHLFLCLSLIVIVLLVTVEVVCTEGVVWNSVGSAAWSTLLSVSLWPQQLPKRKPSTQVPRCLPSVLMHSQTNMQVPSSPMALAHCFGLIFIGSPVQCV